MDTPDEIRTLQHQLPILYGEAVNSKIKLWDISVFTINHIPTIITKHGYIHGKIQTNFKAVDIGKNIGKSNYINPLQNAINIANFLWVPIFHYLLYYFIFIFVIIIVYYVIY